MPSSNIASSATQPLSLPSPEQLSQTPFASFAPKDSSPNGPPSSESAPIISSGLPKPINDSISRNVLLDILKNPNDYDIPEASHNVRPPRPPVRATTLRDPLPLPLSSFPTRSSSLPDPSTPVRTSSSTILQSPPGTRSPSRRAVTRAGQELQAHIQEYFRFHTPDVKSKASPPSSDGDDSLASSPSPSVKQPKARKPPSQPKKKKEVPFFSSDDDDSPSDPDMPSYHDPSDSSRDGNSELSCPSVEDLTRLLIKHARNSRLRSLDFPADMSLRRRKFNAFIDNLTILCQISPWTRKIFKEWPSDIKIIHKNVNIALYNLLYTYANESIQKHLLDSDGCAIKALKTLQRQCAPLTDDHLDRMSDNFRNLRQGDNEVATSYFNRIREVKRECFHAGIRLTSEDLLKRALRGANTHPFYDTTYKSFDRKLDDARLHDQELPTYHELEGALAMIDERKGLTLPSQSRRNYNQHGAYAAIATQRRTPFQPHRNRSSFNSARNRLPNYSNASRRNDSIPNRQCSYCNRFGHSSNECRTRQRDLSSNASRRPNTHNYPSRPPSDYRRNNSSTSNRNHNSGSSTSSRSTASATTSRGPCHICGRLGHYARDCNMRATSRNPNHPRSPNTNNENTRPHNNSRRNPPQNHSAPRALVAHASPVMVQHPPTMDHFETALIASRVSHDTPLPQSATALTTHTTLPTSPHTPPQLITPTENDDDYPAYNPSVMNDMLHGGPAFFHDDPASLHQRFGPPVLQNWLPDSGASSHFTPVYSDLVNPRPSCHHVQMADGSTVVASHVGDVPCYFTSDQGDPSTILLTNVYYISGLNFRLLSLNYSTQATDNSVRIENRATTITFPTGASFTWPLLRASTRPQALAMQVADSPQDTTTRTISPATSKLPSLSLELVSQRLGFRNLRTLLTGSLHSVWRDSQLVPSTDNNNWPVKISVSHKHKRSKEPMRAGSDSFQFLHLDLIKNPFRFGLTANTNFSAYLFIVATPGKLVGWVGLQEESSEEILRALRSWLIDTEKLGRTHRVRFIRSDAGSAFTGHKFIQGCHELGIKLEAAAPKHQEMNGVCESKWKQVHSLANTLLNNARLGGAFFHFAHAYAVAITNILPAKNLTDKDGLPTTPYQICYNRKPRINNFRTFGCPTFFKRYEPKLKRKTVTDKQQLQKASRGIFLGFPPSSAGWLVYSAEMKHRFEISHDAYFDEYFHSALTFDSKPFEGAVPIRSQMDPLALAPAYSNDSDTPSLRVGSVADLGIAPSTFLPDSPDDDNANTDDLSTSPSLPSSPDPSALALAAVAHDFQICNEPSPSLDPCSYALAALDEAVATPNLSLDKYLPEPQSFKAVLRLDDDIRHAWLHAIYLELKNLIDNKTFELNKNPLKSELVIPVKLVLKAKQTASGHLDKLKARIVARGDYQKRRMQKHARQYARAVDLHKSLNQLAEANNKPPVTIELPDEPTLDTWSPNASSRAVKLFLAVMTNAHRTIKEADFIGAYLQANVVGRHFVRLPGEYQEFFPEFKEYFGVPLLLNKGIYGMVFSGKMWNEEFSAWLIDQGFSQSQADPSIFVKHYPGGKWLKLIFFVDDMLYCGSHDSVEQTFQAAVNDRFHVKFLGPAHWFLQMRIHQHKDRSYTLDQHRYVLNTLQRYDPDNLIKPRQTPLPPTYVFSLANRPSTDSDIATITKHYSSINFRSAVCTLLYLAYNTRADILFAVSKLSKACICPGIKDYEALYWLLGYIKARPDYALKFYPDSNKQPIQRILHVNSIANSDLVVFTDASWADCPDTMRSTVGYMIFYKGSLIEANVNVPTPVAQSSCEAEYLGACLGAMATAHVRMIIYDLEFLGTPQWQQHEQLLPKTPALLMTDNSATVQMAKNGRLTRKTRHIERRFHYVRAGEQAKVHTLQWCPSSYMVADVMTKSQPAYKIDPHLPNFMFKLPSHMTSHPETK